MAESNKKDALGLFGLPPESQLAELVNSGQIAELVNSGQIAELVNSGQISKQEAIEYYGYLQPGYLQPSVQKGVYYTMPMDLPQSYGTVPVEVDGEIRLAVWDPEKKRLRLLPEEKPPQPPIPPSRIQNL